MTRIKIEKAVLEKQLKQLVDKINEAKKELDQEKVSENNEKDSSS